MRLEPARRKTPVERRGVWQIGIGARSERSATPATPPGMRVHQRRVWLATFAACSDVMPRARNSRYPTHSLLHLAKGFTGHCSFDYATRCEPESVAKELAPRDCSSARKCAPRFLPTLGRPHAVALRFDLDDLRSGGPAPPRSCPCWAHMKNEAATGRLPRKRAPIPSGQGSGRGTRYRRAG